VSETGHSPFGTPEAARLMRRATYASITTALILVGAKLFAYLATDSVSLLSTLLDSLLDAAASLVNLLAVRTALVPPAAEHRFGHGKAEPLAALGQSAFIAGSALFLLVEAGNRVVNPSPIQNSGIGLVVMGFSILATILLVLYQRHVIRKTGSVAIRADALHYASDLLVNGAVIVSLLLWRQFGWALADPIFAAAREQGVKVPQQLPHAVLFYTAGELTARELRAHGIEYTHFAHGSIYTNMCGADCQDKMATHWAPHLDGKRSIAESLSALVATFK